MSYLTNLKDQKIYNSSELINKIVTEKGYYEINALINDCMYTSRWLQYKKEYKNGKITFWIEDSSRDNYIITKVEFLDYFANCRWVIDSCD